MPLKAQTAKLVSAKKISEFAIVPATTGKAPRQRRASMPRTAGSTTAP